jgi:hypothetical protein
MRYLYIFLTVILFLFCMEVSLKSYGSVCVGENTVLCTTFGTYISDTAVEWSQLHRCVHPILVWGLNVWEYPIWELCIHARYKNCVKLGLIIWILDKSCWWKDNIKMSFRYRVCVCVCVCERESRILGQFEQIRSTRAVRPVAGR